MFRIRFFLFKIHSPTFHIFNPQFRPTLNLLVKIECCIQFLKSFFEIFLKLRAVRRTDNTSEDVSEAFTGAYSCFIASLYIVHIGISIHFILDSFLFIDARLQSNSHNNKCDKGKK